VDEKKPEKANRQGRDPERAAAKMQRKPLAKKEQPSIEAVTSTGRTVRETRRTAAKSGSTV